MRLAVLAPVLALSGCAPHPCTGDWRSAANDESGFVRIHVQYDGKTDIYSADREEAVQRCFWAGEAADSIRLDCVLAENTDIKKHYSMRVSAEDEVELIEAGAVVGRYRRSLAQ